MVLPTSPVVSPLRQRMIEDMRMRQLRRQDAGRLHPRGAPLARLSRPLARHRHGRGSAALPAAPGRAGHLADHDQRDHHRVCGSSSRSRSDRGELMAKMSAVRVAAARCRWCSVARKSRGCSPRRAILKHRAALSVAYGAGLRASEVVALKVSDVDSQRMTLRVEQGKGRKDRYAHAVAACCCETAAHLVARRAAARHDAVAAGGCSPAMDPTDPLTPRQLNRAVHCRRRRRRHRQARVDAHAAPLFRVREYAESGARASLQAQSGVESYSE